MEKQSKVGADDLGWKFHLYHIGWIVSIVSLFVFLDWWVALLIVAGFSFYFFREF